MGVVYMATDLALDRRIALKLHASIEDDVRGSRMWREAKAMARLSDPNVIAVHDVGVFEDRVYIAMELVDGGPASAWLSTPRPWQEVLDAFTQAARGLAAAHRVGLVHRDFKASNMLIGSDGRVRVADFGLARAVGDIAEPAGSGSDSVLSRPPSLSDALGMGTVQHVRSSPSLPRRHVELLPGAALAAAVVRNEHCETHECGDGHRLHRNG